MTLVDLYIILQKEDLTDFFMVSLSYKKDFID